MAVVSIHSVLSKTLLALRQVLFQRSHHLIRRGRGLATTRATDSEVTIPTAIAESATV